MRELRLVFANEWMKLMYRKRLWIALGIAVVLALGLSVLGYYDNQEMQQYNSIEGRNQQIKQDQETIKKLEAELQAGTSNKNEIQTQIKDIKENIKAIEESIKVDKELINGNWKQAYQARINEQKALLKGISGNANEKKTIEAEMKKIQYQLTQNERPLANWETSAYKQIQQLIGLMVKIFLPMLVIIFVADMIAGEATSGTIKLLLVRPVSRIKILLGKWLVSLAATVIFVLSLCLVLWLVNLLMFGTQGTNDPVYVGVSYTIESIQDPMTNERHLVAVAHYDHAELIENWKLTIVDCFLLILPMITVATITFMFSALFKSSMVSTLVSFVFVVIGSLLLEIIGGGKYITWLFSIHFHLVDNWTGEIGENLQTNLSLTFGIMTLIIWSAVSLAIALYTFHRKDIYNA